MHRPRRDSSAISGLTLVPAALLLALGLASTPAGATMITRTYAFQATNFGNLTGRDPVPTDPVQGQVTVTFDPTMDAPDTTSGITLDSLNIPLGFAIAFNYVTSNDRLHIGGLPASTATSGTNDFVIQINAAATASPTFFQMIYTETCCFRSIWSSTSGNVSLVPEPSTAALLGVGLLAITSLRRRGAHR